MRTKRLILWIGGLFIVLVALAFGYYRLILDWAGRPTCHKCVMSGFKIWMEDNGMDINSQTNAFPNTNGFGAVSLTAISNGMAGHMDWAQAYRYVPGLREDDPGDLVLLYLDRPTRWTWHGPAPTIFKEKAWMIVPVDFAMAARSTPGGGELSERVSLAEFRSRLRGTLDYVRTNERPHWQTVVAEHTKFLDSIEHVEP